MNSIYQRLCFTLFVVMLSACSDAGPATVANAGTESAATTQSVITHPEDVPSTMESLRSLSATDRRESIYNLNIVCSVDLAAISVFATRVKDEKLAAQFEEAAQARLEHAIEIGTARTSDFDAILKQTKELGEFRVKTENYSEENIERMVKACAPHLLAELLKT